jgi:DNA-directed RNA polymerase subunit omega
VRPFPIEELVDRVGSRFAVVIAAAKRAKQLKDGMPPLVNLPTRNPLTIALHEIAAGLILIGDAPEPEPEAAASEPAELAAPDAVEALLDKAAAKGRDTGEDADESYDAELDEEIADDLDEEEAEDDEEEEEEEEEEDEEEEEAEAEEPAE